MQSFASNRAGTFVRYSLIVCLFLTTNAAADPPNDKALVEAVEQLAQRARSAYGVKQYTKAISYYLKAYRLAPAGALLYNIAYIYDYKLNERSLAISFYRKYISSEDADPDVVGRATSRLGVLKKQKSPVNTDTVVDSKSNQRTIDGTRNQVDVRRPRQFSRPEMSTQSTWGWTMLGLGGATLAAGGIVGALAAQQHNNFVGAQDFSEKRQFQESGKSRALTADILMGFGAVAATTGLVLLFTDNNDQAARSKSSSLNMALGNQGGMLFYSGAF